MGRRLRAVLVAALLAGGLQATVGAPAAVAGVGARDTTYGTNGEIWVDTAPGTTRVLGTGVLADGSTLTLAWFDQHVDGAPPTIDGRLAVIRTTTAGVATVVARTTVPGLGRPDAQATFVDVQPDGTVTLAARRWAEDRMLVLRLRPDGSLDPAFGSGGVARLEREPCCSIEVTDLVVHPDLAITLLVRYGDAAAVLRLTAAGARDNSFGDGGRVELGTDSYASALDLAAGPGRTLYVAAPGDPGLEPGGSGRSASLQRWAADGALDPTFGSVGQVVLPGDAWALTVGPDGRITMLLSGARVARVTAAGALDPTFDGDGVTPRLVPERYDAPTLVRLAVRADGSVLAADTWSGFRGVLGPDGAVVVPFATIGIARKVSEVDLDATAAGVVLSGTGSRSTATCCGYAMVGLQRARWDGTIDPNYGTDGQALVDLSSGGVDGVVATWVDPQGRLVLVTHYTSMWGIARRLPSGAPDPSFGDGGEVRVFTPAPDAVIGTTDGGIAAIGLGKGGGNYPTVHPQSDLVQRFDASGRPLAGFGTAGQVHLDTYERRSRSSIAELPLGRLAIVGVGGVTVLGATGAPDPTFGGTGTVGLPNGTYPGWSASAVRADALGVVVATSSSAPYGSSTSYETTLRRFLPTGTLDPTYGVGGSLVLPSTSFVRGLLPAGAAGAAATYVTEFDGSTNRVLAGGIVDPTFTPIPAIDFGANTTVDVLGRLLVDGGGYSEHAVRRYLPTGALDLGFGDDGELRVEAGATSWAVAAPTRILLVGTAAEDAWAMAIQPTEPPGIPTVSIAPVTVREGATGDLRFTLDRPGEATVLVEVVGKDETGRVVSDFSTHIPRGQTSTAVALSPPQDALYEGDERVRYEITDATNAEVGTAVAVHTITDDDPVGDAPGAPNLTFVTNDELRFWSDPARPGASTPTLMTVMVFDGNRLGWWRQVNGDRGRVQVPVPPPGKTYRVYVAASNPQGTSPLAGPIVYGNRPVGSPTLPWPEVTNTLEGVLVKWDTDKFFPDLVFSSAPIWSVIATSADGKQVLHASNHTAETRGVVLTDLPRDRDVKVLLVGWFAGGPVVSEAKSVRTSTASNEPFLGVPEAPKQLELARRGAAPSIMWTVDRPKPMDPAIDGFVVKVVRNGRTFSTREYPATVRNAPLVPSEITGGATVQVFTKSFRGLSGSEIIPAAYL